MTKFYKKDYPRPQFVRDSFFPLNGKWNFRFDPMDEGINLHWQNGFEDHPIIVPFSCESKASGIGKTEACSTVWYSRKVALPHHKGKRLLLNFEGSDYRTQVWVNGIYIGVHEGAYTRFSFDITHALSGSPDTSIPGGGQGQDIIVCRIEDTQSTAQPRGKQRWLEENYDCWYTQTTGIWKDVWAEEVGCTFIKRITLTPLYDENSLKIEYELDGQLPEELKNRLEIETVITFGDFPIYAGTETVIRPVFLQNISLVNDNIKWKIRYWRPESPNLYDVHILLRMDGTIIDDVGSYFGLRKISTDSGRIRLNNMDFYLKMVLDQGYWASSLLTPPNEDALIADIKKILEYGYNGVRKHQKTEDERFYYWADVLGLAVWCEAPSFYEFNRLSEERAAKEWIDIVNQHYNHPSVITWVPFNESWGIPRVLCDKSQQLFTQAIYYLTKALDPTRPVVSNDGWEHTKSDIITLHDYAADGESLLAHWNSPEGNLSGKRAFNGERYAFAGGFHYEGQPILLSEFGGIAYGKDQNAWGYGKAENTEEDFLRRFEGLIDVISDMDFISGYCYTQLTDVEQEQNGHMDMEHRDKIDTQKISKIIGGKK